MKNNYTENGDGASIEIDFYYDSGFAHENWKQSFEQLGNNSSDKYCYINWGNVEMHELAEMYIVTDRTRVNVIKELVLHSGGIIELPQEKELEKMTNEELKTEILLHNDYDYDDKDFFEFDSENYGSIVTKGYSQGDWAEVFYNKKELKESWGNEPVEKDLKEEFHNIFWNHPLCFRATIDGEEIDGGEFLSNEYIGEEEAKEEALEYMKKELTKEQFKAFEETFEGMTATYE